MPISSATSAISERIGLLIETIPYAPHGLNIKRLLRIGLDLLAQLADKGHDVAVVKGVFLRPYLGVNLLFGKYPALVGG